MSGTSYVMNKSITSDYDELKRLQVQRDRLEKATLDYKAKGFEVSSLSAENAKLKQALADESKEKARLDQIIQKQLAANVQEIALLRNETEFTMIELEKYKIYAEEIEKNNSNWRTECQKQNNVLDDLAFQAETIGKELLQKEETLHQKREELSQAKLERHHFIQLKAALDRQKHNQQILETDYQTFKKQNQQLKENLVIVEEERVNAQLELEKLEVDSESSLAEIQREQNSLNDEIEAQKIINSNQSSFINELKTEIDQLRRQNTFLKNKLNLLD
jgi:chromosome segregation ATPase